MSKFTKGESEFLNILMSAWIAGQTAEKHGESTENKIRADCEGLMKVKPQFATVHDLLEALEQIRDLETDCCRRCEGNGRLYADGKAHLMSEKADTILCGNCGGSGRILPEIAQDIAEAAIAKVKKEG